ncbi:hypothetical protein [Winogradskyella ouciana]|uniref:Uncharacterized protein n=1 Tax=Winogradskyella ouciana TaxID=2608631 RepID=A0A7K1GG30_9FLAO|nr:hypothetical protein [Winogradskyella ouciana]MTE28277.1 hypothetical protein [Winogradskyella ouciana]
MKTIAILFFIVISNVLISQTISIEDWVQNIVNDMIEMNDLDIYSSEELSPEYSVNFIMVESVKDITITDNKISMLVNHGKGTYCTKITLQYLKRDDGFYLVFSEPRTNMTLGKERKWIDPWIEKVNICD